MLNILNSGSSEIRLPECVSIATLWRHYLYYKVIQIDMYMCAWNELWGVAEIIPEFQILVSQLHDCFI